MRIFLTGASGFLGYNLLKGLLNRENEVYVLSRKPYEKFRAVESASLHLLIGDLRNLDAVECPPFDVCIHFAWAGLTRDSVSSTVVQEENFNFSIRLFDFARKHGCKSFLMAGTRQEYAPTEDFITENSLCDPLSEYGKWKYALHNQLKDLCREAGMQYIHFRIFSVYGYGDHPWSLVSSLIRNLRDGTDIELGMCLHEWSYLYIDDFVSAIISVLLSLNKLSRLEIFNLAGAEIHPLKYFVESVKECVHEDGGTESQLLYGAFKENSESVFSLKPVTIRIRLATGWQEAVDFKQGIKKILHESK